MPLILLEGPRNSGKTHLSDKITQPKFKFDFTGVYGGLNLPTNGKTTHSLGLGKEIMLHQLYSKGFLGNNLIVDRGVLTNEVWGIYQERVSYTHVFSEIDFMISSGLFDDVDIILIKSDVPMKFRKNKDHWDHLENNEERLKELSIFEKVSDYMSDAGIRVHQFSNHFDSQSEENFLKLIDKLICAES